MKQTVGFVVMPYKLKDGTSRISSVPPCRVMEHPPSGIWSINFLSISLFSSTASSKDNDGINLPIRSDP
jgi:hypothetical protein